MGGRTATLRAWLRHWWHRIVAEIAKFGIVGAVAFVVDNGAYAFFQYGWFGPVNGPLYGHEKLASVAATFVATLVSWVGNRYWTFRRKRADDRARELALFLFFNAVGALITMVCIAVAIDVVGVRGLVWETTARNVGIVVGTLFRFWTYRRFVFTAQLIPPAPPAQPGSTEPGAAGTPAR